jgi:hypothetical protein
MRALAIGVSAGLCLISTGAASAETGGVLDLVCTNQGSTVASMTVAVDVNGRRAKGRAMAFHGEVPFSAAQITPDAVSWQNETEAGHTGTFYTTHWILDRNTGSLSVISGQTEAHYMCKRGERLF